jgi:hypothetical protein
LDDPQQNQVIMSKYISEIINDIKTNPETWKRYGNAGLQKGDIIIRDCGNGHKCLLWFTSVVEVEIDGIQCWELLTWLDKYRMEETFLWWMRNATLAMMK